ncbi:hypothetical protein GCM10029992_34030 [Glycomyces albus]
MLHLSVDGHAHPCHDPTPVRTTVTYCDVVPVKGDPRITYGFPFPRHDIEVPMLTGPTSSGLSAAASTLSSAVAIPPVASACDEKTSTAAASKIRRRETERMVSPSNWIFASCLFGVLPGGAVPSRMNSLVESDAFIWNGIAVSVPDDAALVY